MNGVSRQLTAFTHLAAASLAAAALTASAQTTPKPKASKGTGPDIMLMQPKNVKTGENQFEVMVKGANGKPLTGADVSLLFVMPAMPAMNMAEMRNEVKLKATSPGLYTGPGNVMMAGKWGVTVSVKQAGKEVGQKKLTLTAK